METKLSKHRLKQTNPERSIVKAEISPALEQVAHTIAKSNIIPQIFQNSPANCLIAMEMAQRIGASILAVMQSMYIVHGKPAWSGQFIIASVNSTGRFTPLEFEFSEDRQSCRAKAKNKSTGELVVGPPVSIEMAKAEGWWERNPKWKNMTELMLSYRAGSFFGRVHTPDVLMGMREEAEIIEVEAIPIKSPEFKAVEPPWAPARIEVDETSNPVKVKVVTETPSTQPFKLKKKPTMTFGERIESMLASCNLTKEQFVKAAAVYGVIDEGQGWEDISEGKFQVCLEPEGWNLLLEEMRK